MWLESQISKLPFLQGLDRRSLSGHNLESLMLLKSNLRDVAESLGVVPPPA
jgi:hypothetical protein